MKSLIQVPGIYRICCKNGEVEPSKLGLWFCTGDTDKDVFIALPHGESWALSRPKGSGGVEWSITACSAPLVGEEHQGITEVNAGGCSSPVDPCLCESMRSWPLMMKPLLVAYQVDVAALTTQVVVLVLTDKKGDVQVCFCSLLMNRESFGIRGMAWNLSL